MTERRAQRSLQRKKSWVFTRNRRTQHAPVEACRATEDGKAHPDREVREERPAQAWDWALPAWACDPVAFRVAAGRDELPAPEFSWPLEEKSGTLAPSGTPPWLFSGILLSREHRQLACLEKTILLPDHYSCLRHGSWKCADVHRCSPNGNVKSGLAG
jgi:hypothetical protein